jgi:hypothetical protein
MDDQISRSHPASVATENIQTMADEASRPNAGDLGDKVADGITRFCGSMSFVGMSWCSFVGCSTCGFHKNTASIRIPSNFDARSFLGQFSADLHPHFAKLTLNGRAPVAPDLQ